MSGIAQRMKAADARRLTRGEYDAICEIIDTVDRKARDIEARWGIGRLPAIVPLDLSQRFHSQRRKFSETLVDWNVAEAAKHGAAMERAYAALEAAALAGGHEPVSSDQWEFETPDGLVILVKDKARTNMAELHDRRAQVWSVDEIASVIRAHPIRAAAKDAFPGATVESIRPPSTAKLELDDDLAALPF